MQLRKIFQVTVAGGSYQEALVTHMQGVPSGIYFEEKDIYFDLLQRKPGQGELSSPRREPDIPIIFSGVNRADTMPGFKNEGQPNVGDRNCIAYGGTLVISGTALGLITATGNKTELGRISAMLGETTDAGHGGAFSAEGKR
jgi:hypothetical protein